MYFKTTDALSEHGKKFNARCFHMNHGVRFDPVYTVSTTLIWIQLNSIVYKLLFYNLYSLERYTKFSPSDPYTKQM